MIDPDSARKDQEQAMPKVREDPERGVVVDNLKHFAVRTFADCERLLDEGLSNRTVGSTAMNASSSRSHCGKHPLIISAVLTLSHLCSRDTVFTLELEQLDKKSRSKITLIDLAGSEKTQTAKTEGQGLLEGININKSLSCLGQCIAALAKAANKKDAEEAGKSQEQKDKEAEEKKAKEEKEKKV